MKLLFACFDFEDRHNSSRSIRELGKIDLNFSTTHEFTVDKQNRIQEKPIYTLRCTEKKPEDKIPVGFWGDRIYNVSALVGVNGVGKSTLLHSLINTVVMGLDPNVPFLLVLQKTSCDENSDSNECSKEQFIVYYGGDIIVNQSYCDGILQGIKPTNTYPEELKRTKSMLLDNTLSVSSIDLDEMYSNRLPIVNHDRPNDRIEPKPVSEWVKQLYNKSLFASIRYSNEMSVANQPRYYHTIGESLSAHFRYESYQEIRFLFDPLQQTVFDKIEEAKYPFPRPSYVYVTIFDVEGMHRVNQTKFDITDEESFTIPTVCKHLTKSYFWHKMLAATLYVIYSIAYEVLHASAFSQVLTLIDELYNDDKGLQSDDSFAEAIAFEVTALLKNVIRDPYAYVPSTKKEEEDANKYALMAVKENAENCYNFIKYINKIGYRNDLSGVFHWIMPQFQEDISHSANFADFKIDIRATNAEPELRECVIRFLELYRRASEYVYFMNFTTGLSSGQKNILRMLTQFRYLLTNPGDFEKNAEPEEKVHNSLINWFAYKRNKEYTVEVCDTLFLFLDEADLTYHPEWQRKFIALLTTILPKMYQKNYGDSKKYGCKDIQVIIATHSPLLLSDIPRQSCIFLNKPDAEEQDLIASDIQTAYVIDNSLMPQTFGANIHSLLNNVFFLKNTIGEFAYRRITSIFNDLKKLEASPSDPELVETCKRYKQEIDLIGDPLVRNKLRKLYDRCFPSRKDTREVYSDIAAILDNKQSLNREERSRLLEMAACIEKHLQE